MSDEEFQQALLRLRDLEYREDFEAALCELYIACEACHRDQIRADVASGVLKDPPSWRDPTDCSRLKTPREQRHKQQLILHSIRGAGKDFRDDLCGFAFTYHNLLLIGVDADAFFERVASLSDETFGGFVRSFVRRKPEDKSMKAFCLAVFQAPDGSAVGFK